MDSLDSKVKKKRMEPKIGTLPPTEALLPEHAHVASHEVEAMSPGGGLQIWCPD